MHYLKSMKVPSSEYESEVLNDFIRERRKEQIKKMVDEIIDDEYTMFESYAQDFITETAAQRATQFIDRLLCGDEDAARELFGHSSRYRQAGMDAGEPWASLIHGKVFETGPMELRKRLVEVHADLIRDERIKDLESIIEGLKLQVREREREIEEMRGRF